MEVRVGARRTHILSYFFIWFGLVVVTAIFNALNINWEVAHPVQGLVVVMILTLIEGSALEFLMMTVVSLIYSGIGGHRRTHIPRNYDHSLTLIINFNLLAHSEEDIDNAYKHMHSSFMSNLSPDISAVLLSVTGKPQLKRYEIFVRDQYRALIRKTLMDEGRYLLQNLPQNVDPFRLRYFWKNFTDMEDEELQDNLEGIAAQVANEFMCIHRVSKVLKKCGQYQDLFLLSEGETKAYTYTDISLYSTMARPYDQPLFHESADVTNIHCRHFDYTLIMDNDTICPAGTAQELLAVAAAHPTRGIIQPSIKMNVKASDTIYMHLEMWRQRLNDPLSRSMATLYGQWGFYGKGMINNKVYVDKMIGTRDHILEIVPIDVLSHDTYEAAVLCPLYVDSLYFEEEPSYNYVTWHIRERRWNQGELILTRYFWPNIFGRPIDFLRKLFDKRNFIHTKIRTKFNFGLVSTHIAHSALRSMFMKPMMLIYVFLQMGVPVYRPLIPLVGMLFLVCIFPKFAITNMANARFALMETLASILQYTPEAFVGTVRLGQAVFATICKSCTDNWTPQRVVEEDMRNSNPFASSMRHMWAYSVVAIVTMVVFAASVSESNIIFFMFATVIIMPLFTGITSLNPDMKTVHPVKCTVNGRNRGTPEITMEEGGPRVQWSNIMNDPPDRFFYGPTNYMHYESEDSLVLHRLRGRWMEDDLEAIEEAEEQEFSSHQKYVQMEPSPPPSPHLSKESQEELVHQWSDLTNDPPMGARYTPYKRDLLQEEAFRQRKCGQSEHLIQKEQASQEDILRRKDKESTPVKGKRGGHTSYRNRQWGLDNGVEEKGKAQPYNLKQKGQIGAQPGVSGNGREGVQANIWGRCKVQGRKIVVENYGEETGERAKRKPLSEESSCDLRRTHTRKMKDVNGWIDDEVEVEVHSLWNGHEDVTLGNIVVGHPHTGENGLQRDGMKYKAGELEEDDPHWTWEHTGVDLEVAQSSRERMQDLEELLREAQEMHKTRRKQMDNVPGKVHQGGARHRNVHLVEVNSHNTHHMGGAFVDVSNPYKRNQVDTRLVEQKEKSLETEITRSILVQAQQEASTHLLDQVVLGDPGPSRASAKEPQLNHHLIEATLKDTEVMVALPRKVTVHPINTVDVKGPSAKGWTKGGRRNLRKGRNSLNHIV